MSHLDALSIQTLNLKTYFIKKLKHVEAQCGCLSVSRGSHLGKGSRAGRLAAFVQSTDPVDRPSLCACERMLCPHRAPGPVLPAARCPVVPGVWPALSGAAGRTRCESAGSYGITQTEGNAPCYKALKGSFITLKWGAY